jgi:hypothetical protein
MGKRALQQDLAATSLSASPWTSTLPTLTLLRDRNVDPAAEDVCETIRVAETIAAGHPSSPVRSSRASSEVVPVAE